MTAPRQGERPLRILLLADDRPGHYQLSEGIIAAIAKRRAAETSRIEVRRRAMLPGRLLAWLLARRAGAAALLRAGYGLDPAALPSCDLVVSAGGNTLAANVLAARLQNVPNIFYGSLRRYDPADFAIAFTSYEHQATHPRIVPQLKPSQRDPDDFPLPSPAVEGGRTVGLLIGGDGSGLRFGERDWDDVFGLCAALHARDGSRFVVTNSRRTPAAVGDRLKAIAAERAWLQEFIDVRTAGAGTLGPLFARASAVLVTADSSSMVSEAVWLRRPTLALAPRAGALDDAEATYRRQMTMQGLLANLPIAGTSAADVETAFARLTPLRDNPMDALGGLIEARLPRLFAGS